MPPFTPPRRRPELAIKLWGIDFPNPIGLAAGMDKDAVADPRMGDARLRLRGAGNDNAAPAGGQ